MRRGLMIIGIFVILSGLVWIAQGLDLPFAPGSFMTADRSWVVIGSITALAGLVIVDRARNPRD